MVTAVVVELLATDGSQRMQVGCIKSLIFSYLASGIEALWGRFCLGDKLSRLVQVSSLLELSEAPRFAQSRLPAAYT